MSGKVRCQQPGCGGQLYLEAHTEETEDRKPQFIGFRVSCLQCGRPWATQPYVSCLALAALHGVPLDDVLKARAATMAFLWERADA